MYPIYDIDVLVFMATSLASKRRPAELLEIVAAADVLQSFIPYPEKLCDAIERLSLNGLIGAMDGGFTLTEIGRNIMNRPLKKTTSEELTAMIKDNLSAYSPTGNYPPIVLPEDRAIAAIAAYKATRKAPGKSLLMPKPKADRHFKVEGRWRRVQAPR